MIVDSFASTKSWKTITSKYICQKTLGVLTDERIKLACACGTSNRENYETFSPISNRVHFWSAHIGHEPVFQLRWLVGLNLIQLEKQETQLLIILAKKIKISTLQGHKRYMKVFALERNNLRIQILAAKMT